MRAARIGCAVALVVGTIAMGGCGWTGGVNPSFDISVSDARRALKEIRADKKPLERPLVVVGGYMDPGVAVHGLGERFRGLVEEPGDVITVTQLSAANFESARARVVERVEEAFGPGEGDETVEVDVIGISMGGLVARYAAMENGGAHKRLKINRLFTISTPHRGAALAALPTFDKKQLGMRAGSAFLEGMNGADAGYEIVPYTRLGDAIVGVENCAPEGERVIWVANNFPEPAHLGAQDDPRFSADIARRLRGEAAFVTEPRAALPE